MDTIRGSFAEQRVRWTPGSRDLTWHRVVIAVDAARGELALDAPITTALEARWGGGTVARVVAGAPARRVGVEDLTLVSAADTAANPRDEEHAWIAVALDRVEDAWVRRVVARGFVASAVRVGPLARRVTVERARAERPVSELGGYRRQSFLVEGEQVLVRRCTAEGGLNDFAVGLLAAGPNAFVEDTARGALGASGSFESWASGVLYERVRVEGAALRLAYDLGRAQGGGWTAANAVAWGSSADTIVARGPEGAPNLVVDSAGPLYDAQLAQRPSTRYVPARELPPAPTARDTAPPHAAPPLAIVNGRFVVGGRALWGGTVHEGWWRGQANPATALDHGISATRWVPGRDGPGLTENLDALTARMAADGTPFYDMIPGLWYDRRRDDHTTAARPDGNVWAPFYELPWARSGRGEGTAWDGLSRYDLARFNPWYFARARELARLAARRGLVVYHNLYNTHNLLEIGPHWADYPWRRANNVNGVGPAEPDGEAPPERVHVANEVFDTADPRAAALHRAFILHTLDVLGPEPNVVFGVGFQYAGPLAFQRFFLDVVDEWSRRTGRRVRVALTTSRDVTDSVLADPRRARHVAVVDTRYWQYRSDGSLWAPRGGRNLAFREMIAADFGAGGDTPPPTTPLQAYRQVREYRDRYPALAVVAWQNGVGPIPALMAGAAQVLMRNPAAGHNQARVPDRTPLDGFVRTHLATRLHRMTPRDGWLADSARTWALADARGEAVLVYSVDGESIAFTRTLPRAAYRGLWLDPRTGDTRPLGEATPRPRVAIPKPSAQDWLLLLEAR
jgi:hypothetical protein